MVKRDADGKVGVTEVDGGLARILAIGLAFKSMTSTSPSPLTVPKCLRETKASRRSGSTATRLELVAAVFAFLRRLLLETKGFDSAAVSEGACWAKAGIQRTGTSRTAVRIERVMFK